MVSSINYELESYCFILMGLFWIEIFLTFYTLTPKFLNPLLVSKIVSYILSYICARDMHAIFVFPFTFKFHVSSCVLYRQEMLSCTFVHVKVIFQFSVQKKKSFSNLMIDGGCFRNRRKRKKRRKKNVLLFFLITNLQFQQIYNVRKLLSFCIVPPFHKETET